MILVEWAWSLKILSIDLIGRIELKCFKGMPLRYMTLQSLKINLEYITWLSVTDEGQLLEDFIILIDLDKQANSIT